MCRPHRPISQLFLWKARRQDVKRSCGARTELQGVVQVIPAALKYSIEFTKNGLLCQGQPRIPFGISSNGDCGTTQIGLWKNCVTRDLDIILRGAFGIQSTIASY